MLPADCIQVRIVGSQAIPVWLGVEDHPWLRSLIDDFVRLDGRPYREVVSFLQEPSRTPSPAGKRRMAIRTLQNLCTRDRPPIDASALRDAVAAGAQRARDEHRFDRWDILETGARRFGLSATTAEELLFADLPGERRLRFPDPPPDPHLLATRTNLGLAQGLLRLASDVSLQIYGGARAIVRQVHLRRLLSTVRRTHPEGVRLDISGPFSLFRHTTMYGRALASILPLLPWCERFDLVARCVLRGQVVSVRFRPGDPIAVGEPPRAYDSRLEERFAREFARANLDWDVVREPEPVQAGDALVFPDFEVVHRRDTSKRFLLEIVGFWTPEYLREKLDRLRAMSPVPTVLCIDRGLNCSPGDLPAHARIVWFQKRIDPGAVLAAINAPEAPIALPGERLGLCDLFIDWAGRSPATAPVHRRLAALEVGDAVQFRKDGPRVVIEADGEPIAILSRPGCARWISRLDRVASAKLVEKVERHAEQSPPQWRAGLQCEHWIVPVVEVVLYRSAEQSRITPESRGKNQPEENRNQNS